jgi:hypothetical protein
MILKPLPSIKYYFHKQPSVVSSLDTIREALEDETYSEFYFYAREYPRNYRYHLSNAEYRLKSIHEKYKKYYEYSKNELKKRNKNLFSFSQEHKDIYKIYWDFEAFLNAVSASLDTVARICGLFYEQQTPLSFNRLCSKKELGGIVDVLRLAQRRWIKKLKDYRDCFVHYTPIDNMCVISCVRYSVNWEVRCGLPINPNIREQVGFRFSRRSELLRYSIYILRNLNSLDRAIGKEIMQSYKRGKFPMKVNNLFFTGKRERVGDV